MSMNMRSLAAAALLCLGAGLATPAQAQTVVNPGCNTFVSLYPASSRGQAYSIDQRGAVCINGSITASLSGFTPAGTFATLTATNASASVALPAGAVVIFQNTGTTAVSCTLGVGSATATVSQNIVQPASWLALTVGSNTFGACIDVTGSTSNLVVLSGGAGLPTGAGGGGGSGGGGAITAASGAFASGSLSAGAAVDLLTMRGTKAPGTAATNSLLTGGIYTAAGVTLTDGQQAAVQFDSTGNLKVSGAGVAQGSTTSGQTLSPIGAGATSAVPSYTTGQTNILSLTLAGGLRTDFASVNGNTALAGNGVTGAGSQRVTVASDNTPFAVKIDQTTPGTTNAIRTIAGATGGGTLTSAIAPATPAGVNLKVSAGTVFRVFATTIQATPVYIKFYNSATAPTCGTGTPVGRFMVPVASTAANGAGTNIDIGDIGASFGTGIGYCVTGALADADTTAITANNTLVNIVWN